MDYKGFKAIEIALDPAEWYHKGNIAEKEDTEAGYITKFIFHWIAFNMLYDSGDTERTTRAEIKEFYRMNRNIFDKYDAFCDPAIIVFKERPIGRGKLAGIDFDEIRKNNPLNLLYAIYAVRNNLFHGSKTMKIDRNVDLVRSSSIILGNYLKCLLDEPKL